MKYFKDYGFYIPSFFYVQINEKEDFERTLFHELIHFMQDISTTFGLINISKTVDFIKELNRICREEGKIPSSYNRYISKPYEINKDLFSYYFGDGAEKYRSFNPTMKVLDIRHNDGLIKGYEGVKEIELVIGNGDIQDSFHFGQLAIAESMAHELECYVYGEPCQKSYPYSVVSMIVEYIYPPLNKPLAISELCEASLMYYNPADVLIRVLEIMKEQNFQNINEGDIYKFILNNMNMVDDDGNKINATKQYNEEVIRATEQIDDLMTVEPLKSKKLISGFISNARKFKEKNGPIITNHFKYKNISFMKEIGAPLIIDEDNVAYANEIEIFYYSIIYSIFNKLSNYNDECHLYSYCSQSKEQESVFNENCKNRPWEKVSEKLMCPYSTVWKMWDLPKI